MYLNICSHPYTENKQNRSLTHRFQRFCSDWFFNLCLYPHSIKLWHCTFCPSLSCYLWLITWVISVSTKSLLIMFTHLWHKTMPVFASLLLFIFTSCNALIFVQSHTLWWHFIKALQCLHNLHHMAAELVSFFLFILRMKTHSIMFYFPDWVKHVTSFHFTLQPLDMIS